MSARVVIELIDRVTGPAKRALESIQSLSRSAASLDLGAQLSRQTSRASAALQRMASQMDAFRGRLQSAISPSIPKVYEGISGVLQSVSSRVQSAIAAVSSAVSRGASGAAKGMSRISSAFIGGVEKIHASVGLLVTAAGLVGSAVSAVGGAAMRITGFALEASRFKSETQMGLKYLLGGQKEAQSAYKLIQQMADKTPFTDETVAGFFKQFKGAGFQITEASRLIASLADLRLTASEQQTKQVALALSQIKGKGKLQGEEILQLTEGSGNIISRDSIIKSLQRQLGGKSAADVEKLLQKGAITADNAMTAFFDTIKEKFYKGKADAVLGTASAEMSKTLTGQLSTFESRVKRLFEDVDAGPLAKAMGKVNEALASSQAEQFSSRVQSAFGKIFEQADQIDISSVFSKLEMFLPVIDLIAGIFTGVMIPAVMGLGEGFFSVLDVVMPVLSQITGELLGTTSASETVKSAFKAIGTVLGVIATIIAVNIALFAALTSAVWTVAGAVLSLAVGAIKWLIDKLKSIGSAVAGAASSLWSTGTSLIDGLWEGIKSAFSSMLGRFSDLMKQLPAAVKSLLGIASPSKVFLELGLRTGEGFAAGIEYSAPQVETAVSEMVLVPSDLPDAATLSTAASTSSTSVSANGWSITIGGSQLSAEQIRSAVLAALTDYAGVVA